MPLLPAGRADLIGYREVEREVANWVFRKRGSRRDERPRMQVSQERLKDSYDKGGAQLVDLEDKVRAQRVGWLCRLLAMPRDSFPRVVAEFLIRDAAPGYGGLGVLAADLGLLRVGPVGGFYGGAIKAWAILNPRIRARPGETGSNRLFYNPGVVDNQGLPLRPVPALERLAIITIGQLRTFHGVGVHRDVWDQIVRLRGFLPADDGRRDGAERRFVFEGVSEDRDDSNISFKELYLAFRSKRPVTERHFEGRWERELGGGLRGQWPEIWRGVQQSECSSSVKSHIWLQINLNFWTNWMQFRFYGEGDGACWLCRDRAEERWHLLIECRVVRDLWGRLYGSMLRGLVDEPVDRREMGLGAQGQGLSWKLRSRLGFTLRSAVHSLRAHPFLSENDAERRIWRLFLHRLKKDLMEDYYTAKLKGDLALFERKVLVGGVLGRLDGTGRVVWAGELAGVGYDYWDLFD